MMRRTGGSKPRPGEVVGCHDGWSGADPLFEVEYIPDYWFSLFAEGRHFPKRAADLLTICN